MTLDYINLSPQELGKLLAAGSGDAALVYLYMKSTGDFGLKHAETQLSLSPQALGWAESLLKRLGLMESAVPRVRYEKAQAPVYSGEEVSAFSAQDPGFALLQGEVSRRMGRVLTTEELKTLLSLRDYLNMSPEIISVALTHCLQKAEYYNKTYGKNRTVSMRTLEKECYDWANRGIETLQQAAAYTSHDLARLAPEGRVRKMLGLDRALVDSEKQYIQSWLDLGFPLETIKLAYEKTVLATGKLAWRYMDKILLSWHEKNLHTVKEVSGEARPAPVPADQSFTPGTKEVEAIGRLRKIRDRLEE